MSEYTLLTLVSYPDPTPRREGSGNIRAFSWLCCVSSHMTLITCLHHLLLHSRSHERSISAFVIAISCLSLCSYVRVAKGYLCLHCQAGAVRSRDQCHVLLTQHNQGNARMSPDPSLRGVGSGHETILTRVILNLNSNYTTCNIALCNFCTSTKACGCFDSSPFHHLVEVHRDKLCMRTQSQRR